MRCNHCFETSPCLSLMLTKSIPLCYWSNFKHCNLHTQSVVKEHRDLVSVSRLVWDQFLSVSLSNKTNPHFWVLQLLFRHDLVNFKLVNMFAAVLTFGEGNTKKVDKDGSSLTKGKFESIDGLFWKLQTKFWRIRQNFKSHCPEHSGLGLEFLDEVSVLTFAPKCQSRTGVGNLWLTSQMWLFWWWHLARLIFSQHDCYQWKFFCNFPSTRLQSHQQHHATPEVALTVRSMLKRIFRHLPLFNIIDFA